MMAGLVARVVVGVSESSGGLAEVWEEARGRGRLVLAAWTADPRERTSSLAIFSGQFVQWAAIYGCHQDRCPSCIVQK